MNSLASLFSRTLSKVAKQGRRAPQKLRHREAAAVSDVLESRLMLTFDIQFDYSYDTSGFFTDTARRDLLDDAAAVFEARITDDLDGITPSGINSWTAIFNHPATGVSTSVTDLVVPADTLIVYPGSRSLSGVGLGGPGGLSVSGTAAFVDNVLTRGETGVDISGTTDTDFSAWGGTIVFDSGTTWGFDPSAPVSGATDFYSVALHELAHVLGYGTADSYENKISSGEFTGAAVVADFGGNVTLSSEEAHWDFGTSSFLPGTNVSQEAAMDPNLTTGTRKELTTLDWASFEDIGWEISAAPNGLDYGDAPDTGGGTGTGNYETLLTSGGASHAVDSDIFIGTNVAGDDGTLQDSTANADDSDGSTDDEDGIDVSDLALGLGETPAIDVAVTNNTGATATLFGWIDIDGDGEFESTESASVAVADGTAGDVTLTFPTISGTVAASTFARFRLTTDSSITTATPNGAASDGEVEDYPVTISTTVADVNLSVSTNSGSEAGATVVTITATADTAVSSDQTVNLVLTGSAVATDYALSSTQITILSGATTGTATFTVSDDDVVENSESAIVTIDSVSAGLAIGANPSETISISDNDSATISIADVSMEEGQMGDVTALVLTISLSNPVDGTISLQADTTDGTATTADSDYTALVAEAVSFAALEQTKTVTVNLTGDATLEGDESFTLDLSSLSPGGMSVTIGDSSAAATITDDEYVDELGLLTASGRTPGNIVAVEQGTGFALVPDGDDNGVYISLNAAGDIVLTGLGGSTINGMASDTLFAGSGGVSGIMRVFASAGTMLTAVNNLNVGGMQVFGGASQEALELADVTIAANLTVNLSNADNAMRFSAGTNVGSSSTLIMGAGADKFTVEDAAIGTANYAETGDGDDTITFQNSAIPGPLAFIAGAGTDVFNFSTVTTTNALRLDAGGDGDTMNLDGLNAGQKLILEPGNGTDVITLSNSDVASGFSTNLRGSNTLALADTTLQTSLNINTLSSRSLNSIELDSVSITESTSINAVNGTSVINLDSVTAGQIFVVLTGNQSDTIEVGGNSDFQNTLNISTQFGDDSVTVNGSSTIQTLNISTGTDVDTVNLDSVMVSNQALLNTGEGADILTFSSVSVSGRTLVEMDEGNDSLTVTGSTFARTDFLGGADDDTVDFSLSTTFNGTASIRGESGNDTISMNTVTFTKSTTLDAGDDDDFLDLTQVTLDSSSGAFTTTFQPGAGDDEILLTNSGSDANATINLGPVGGNTVVDLQGNTFGAHVQVATSNAHMGVRVKNNSFTTANYIASATHTNDSFLDDGTNTYTSGPTRYNFDDLTNTHIDALFEDLMSLLFP